MKSAIAIIFATTVGASVFHGAELARNWEEIRRSGSAARQSGRYPDALRDLESALAEAHFSDADLRRADLDDELASVYEVLGDSPAAARVYRDALSVLEKHPADAPRIRSLVIGDYGLFLATQGKLNEAREVLETGIVTTADLPGQTDTRMASLRSRLGQLYLLEERLADAEPLLLSAVQVHRATLPPNDVDRVMSELSLGFLYVLSLRRDEAQRMLLFANEDARQLGEMHPALASTLMGLADFYRAEGNPSRGAPLLKQALAIYEKSLGPESTRVADTLLDMSIDSIAAKKYAIAEEQLLRALAILRKASGPEHPAVMMAESRLAKAYTEEGRYAEAEALLRHALPIAESTWPDGHTAVADCLYQFAEVERLQHRFADAESLYRRGIAMYEKFGPPAAHSLAVTLQQYAKLLRTTRTEEAKALERRAQTLQKSFQ